MIVRNVSYLGLWAVRISNGVLAGVILPEWGGRVIELRRIDGASPSDNALWTNPYHLPPGGSGRLPVLGSEEHQNAGGITFLPGPQALWPEVIGRNWPPPAAYVTDEARVRPGVDSCQLLTATDPHFGLAVHNTFVLCESALSITTRLVTRGADRRFRPSRRTCGPRVRRQLHAWQIAQVMPWRTFVDARPLPPGDRRFNALAGERHDSSLRPCGDGLIELVRDERQARKFGFAPGSRTVDVGPSLVLTVTGEAIAGATYPEQNSALTTYLADGDAPWAYVEHEPQGLAGQHDGFTATYCLTYRAPGLSDLEAARTALGT